MGMKAKQVSFDEGKALDSQKKAADLNQQYNQYELNYGNGQGGVSWSGEGPNRQMNVNYSDSDKERQYLISNALKGMSLNPNEASDKYYQNAINMLKPQIDQNVENTRNNLINMGYNPGSTGFDNSMAAAEKDRQLALNNLATDAMMGGQQYISSGINNIGAMQSQITNPLAGYQMTNNPYFQDSYSQKIAIDAQNAQMKNQQNAAGMSALGSVAGAGIGAWAGRK